ncbi:MAG: hypothetical protein KBF37_12560 [Saprospiraceae bacterium]|jgi:hypothetical protein|nr:hypothetical protein [Saprospiraceae bacterium]MBP9211139.1 hypothetical protein [Saprospiraceae bacterium]
MTRPWRYWFLAYLLLLAALFCNYIWLHRQAEFHGAVRSGFLPPVQEDAQELFPPQIDPCVGVVRYLQVSDRIRVRYCIPEDSYQAAKENRQPSNFFSSFQTLGEYYRLLEIHDAPELSRLASTISKFALTRSLSYQNILVSIVNSIQRIEYTFVHQGSHEDFQLYTLDADHAKHLGRFPSGNACQLGGCCEMVEPIGIFSPVEVAYHQLADCDSRVVFLHCLLGLIGIPSVILISEIEAHALLGVYLPSNPWRGDAVIYDPVTQKNYVVWETTSAIPPGIYKDFSPDNWKIVAR